LKLPDAHHLIKKLNDRFSKISEEKSISSMTTKRTKTRLDFSYQYEEEEIVREGAKRERPKIRISLRPDKRFGYLPTNLSPVERFERVISKKRLVKTPIIQESKSFVETSSKNKITGFNEFAKQSKRKDLFKHP